MELLPLAGLPVRTTNPETSPPAFSGDHIAEEFQRILDEYVASHYPAAERSQAGFVEAAGG